MTRLEASNEPSMEDILASIRKIIAEDPPGSRPVPQQPAERAAPAASQASSSFGRAPTRELAAREPLFSSEPATPPAEVTPEPYLRATPAKSDTSTFGSAPFFMPKGEPKPLASRIEPSFAAMSAPVPALSAIPDPAPAPTALSVDAQLSDLLDDVAIAPAALPIEPAFTSLASTSAAADVEKRSVDFAAKLMGRSSPAPADIQVQAERRPGFSVSRVGFAPENTTANADAKSGADAGRDPFDFDLGPSPFELKAVVAETARAPEADDPRRDVSSFDDIVPLRHAEPDIAPEPAPSAAAIEQAAVGEEQPADLNFVSGPLPYVAPSVEATVQPPAPEPAPVLAAVEPEIAMLVSEPAVIEEVVPELEPHQIDAPQYHGEAGTDGAASAASFAHIASGQVAQTMQMSLPSAAQRTMEDTVADLLRPMLKSWLAENMPKIVERALRRELTEQLHSEHKAAAE